MRAPAGFDVARSRRTCVAARPGDTDFVAEAVERSGSLHAFARENGGTGLHGRTTAWTLTAGHRAWVVRHYARGGAMAPLLGDRYLRLGTPRPVREAEVSDRARERGVSTPEVQAFVVHFHGPFYRADIATARIPGALDLADATLGPVRLPEAGRIEAWREAGRLLRTVFEAGVVHADLNLRNIVLSGSDTMTAHLLDLDRCRIVRRCSPGHIHAMLQRLHRSRLKLEGRLGNAVDEAALAAFQEALDG